MHVNAQTDYVAPPDAVVALRLNPDFLTDLCRRTGAIEQTVTVTPEDGAAGRSVTRRTMPTTDFPDVARRFVGETVILLENVEWDPPREAGVRTGRYVMRAEGLPVGFEATIRLTETPSGSREVLTGEIKAKVALVGGRIERAIEPAVKTGLDAQAEAVEEWHSR